MRASASSGGGLRGGGSEPVARTFILRDSKEEIVLVTELGLILFEEELEEGSLRCPWLEGAGDSSGCLRVLETLRVTRRRTWIFYADF